MMDMATSHLSQTIQGLRRILLHQDGAGMSDRQLLDHFIGHRDEAAFAALVRRHGPVVWGVCCRVIGHYHDAEDAFQATFLVLARKAASIRQPEMLANWLYGVAHRTALKAKATTGKRRVREKQVSDMPEPETKQRDAWLDLEPLIDRELASLPDKYRIAIILCDLQGKTGKEAAHQLKIPEGTLSSRLRTGRVMLAKRLARNGVALSAGALAAVVSQNSASALAPTAVVSSTIKAAPLFAAGQTAATGLVSGKVAALTEGVMKAMLMTKLKTIATVLVLATLIAFGGGLVSHQMAATAQLNQQTDGAPKNSRPSEGVEGKPDPAPKPVKPPQPLGQAALAEKVLKDNVARTVILENSKIFIEPGTKVRLTPVKTEKGNGVRLEWAGVTVEALNMKLLAGTQIIEIEGAEGGMFTVRVLQKGADRVGAIIVVGNTKTPDSTIRKALQLAPGDVFDDKSLRAAEKRLATLKAVITVIENGDESGVKDIVVRVKE
jgi:RNA polymerase sigma factor (sigma-70 family)